MPQLLERSVGAPAPVTATERFTSTDSLTLAIPGPTIWTSVRRWAHANCPRREAYCLLCEGESHVSRLWGRVAPSPFVPFHLTRLRPARARRAAREYRGRRHGGARTVCFMLYHEHHHDWDRAEGPRPGRPPAAPVSQHTSSTWMTGRWPSCADLDRSAQDRAAQADVHDSARSPSLPTPSPVPCSTRRRPRVPATAACTKCRQGPRPRARSRADSRPLERRAA